MELPRLKPLYEKWQDQGLQIVAVDTRRDTEKARQFISENALPYLFVENGEGEKEIAAQVYGVHAVPTTFIIDPQGFIRYFHLGFEEGMEKEMEKEIQTLIQ